MIQTRRRTCLQIMLVILCTLAGPVLADTTATAARAASAQLDAAWIETLGLLLAAIVGIVGSYLAFIRAPRTLKSIEFKLAFVEDQLQYVYGPLFGTIKESEAAYETALAAIGEGRTARVNPYDFLGGRSEHEEKAWTYFSEKYFLPYNDHMAAIISKHRHLLGPWPPSSIDDFVAHAEEYKVRFYAFKDMQLSSHDWTVQRSGNVLWPDRFVAEVEGKLALLRALQAEYRTTIEGRPPRNRIRRDAYFVADGNRVNHGPYTEVELRVFARRAAEGGRSLLGRGVNFEDAQIYDSVNVRTLPYRDLLRFWDHGA